ncbi:hypothetical protein C2857_006481 [Epichloe festucae Fl1]|uniref:Elongator complex protein 6 n=1 Tax=Epichloe festucae (strain Fl1) TaxID=877507 RepID=A0A7S9PSQ5_EPIFF|nr:hypothetical protein C2857_006481 [Epichloe festucae Fl1]
MTCASTKIPPLLEPYLDLPPEHSLVLVTSVLGASANWLVLRWLYSLLRGRSNVGDGTDTAVVLCSFLRDGAFWREGCGKMALDLERVRESKRFAFVDGLTGLCMPEAQDGPDGGGRLDKEDYVLGGSAAGDVRDGLERAIADVSSPGAGGGRRDVVLVLDQMDAWLAMGDAGVVEVMNLLVGLREKVHATVMTVSADDPLLHAQTTTLEREHAAFSLSLAHEARCVMALRLLDTGTARDVSGVVRMTGGGKGAGGEGDAEYLYHVSGDGGVRVFERGA